jgi:hypothetical protein
MESYIENYCGCWKSESGYRLEIALTSSETVSVKFYQPGEDDPMLRPWMNNSPAVDMTGELDSECGESLDIGLSDGVNSFCLNLTFDLDDSYQKVLPSIIRYEKEGFLDQYCKLIGPLDPYAKC